MNAVIDIQNITKVYNPEKLPVPALNGVTFQLERGEFASLVGPSGSGKTTLLNIIGGLDMPTSGSIIVDGTDITRLHGSKLIDFRLKNIGFVFQSYNLIPVLSAKENIEFTMLLQNKSKADRHTRVMQLLTEVGMPEKADARPLELSGGQQQRVAVARALAPKPQFILADEPTANLDSVAAGNLLDIMERLNREEQVTFLFSTHDARVIERAHRVITLQDGRIISDERRVR